MNDHRLKLLFEKYIAKTCTPAELSELLGLIHSSDDKLLEPLLDEIYQTAPEENLSDRSAKRVLNTILEKRRGVLNMPKNSLLWLAAASVVILITVGVLNLQNPHQPGSNESRRVIAQTKNDHQFIKLPDGSTVILNKNSYVKFPSKFQKSRREVSLVGEGYFDIQHDVTKPFIVHVGNLSVTVLGTAFNINAAKGRIAVTVTRGKVSVSDATRTLGAITPNEQISYDQATSKANKININALQAIHWQASDIYFDDVTMQEAAQILEDRFHQKISFASEQLKNCKLTGAFTHGESLTEVLKVICEFNNAKFQIKNSQVMINGPGC